MGIPYQYVLLYVILCIGLNTSLWGLHASTSKSYL
jgi:hypothetical protein